MVYIRIKALNQTLSPSIDPSFLLNNPHACFTTLI